MTIATTRTAPRPTMGALRQTLRLTRMEFTLFMRYKTAWLFLAMALFLIAVPLNTPGEEVFGGMASNELSALGMMGSIAVIIGVGHPSNVFTARREALVLKRMRAGGVPSAALFGAVTAIVAGFSLVIAALGVGLMVSVGAGMPQDPVMLLFAVALSAVPMTFLGLLITPLARNAESAQMAAMAPIMLLLFSGGVMPVGLFPDILHKIFSLLPSAATGQLIQAGYTGYDVFGGFEGASAVGPFELWVAALPSIGVLFAWTAVLGVAVHRWFKWDPRQA
ncbi:ABC transporter permease [Nocardiopsis algeriensis]|uniref:ABC-2 type transport system permease protein n=1 Tax=Nocardiopsis algeriensis TaxID=1478215 RepID=A0A841IPZ3_9ACTN|nr:ABC transporter permease [Nocardiopsis algeriensis]MBB6118401.1 ABC-2 type transport system permease protein [Nocardiopsis algeriensis]